MVNPIAWIDAERDLDYAEAVALAASLGGRLLIFDYDPAVFTTLRDYMHREEDPVFIDASSTQSNPATGTARHLIVEFLSPATVVGLSGVDRFMGGPGQGRTLRAGDGDDSYMGGDGDGKIDMGRGNDEVFLGTAGDGVPWANNSPTPGTIIIDGPGQDRIFAEGGVIQASIDGDADTFMMAARVTYGAATTDLVIQNGQVSGGGVGADTLGPDVIEVVGGSGNDTISGVLRIQGGKGDDILTPVAYAEGGAGDDELIADSDQRVELRAEAGDDVLRFFTTAKASGGAGVDTFVFETAAAVTLQDFQAGETLDLSALTNLAVDDLFGEGYLKATHTGGYTQLLWDGNGGGDGFTSFLTLKGVYGQQSLADAIITGPPIDVSETYFTSAVPIFSADYLAV